MMRSEYPPALPQLSMPAGRIDHTKRQIIIDLLKEPGNDHCADCDATINIDNAWAVLSYGILVCDDCKLVHIEHQNYKSSEDGEANDDSTHGKMMLIIRPAVLTDA